MEVLVSFVISLGKGRNFAKSSKFLARAYAHGALYFAVGPYFAVKGLNFFRYFAGKGAKFRDFFPRKSPEFRQNFDENFVLLWWSEELL